MTRDNIPWGDWGTYTFDRFMKDFSCSPEFMKAPLSGYYSLEMAVNFLIDKTSSPVNYSEGDSLTPELPLALYEFATRTVPCRQEGLNGQSVVCNPSRDNRAGACPSVPAQAPDIFKWIIDGDENKGHAIVAEFDQETSLGCDDIYTSDIISRRLQEQDAHAVAIVNKFPAYVRIIDDKLVRLLDQIGFTHPAKFKDGKPSVLKTIPFGLNFVSFPFEYVDSLSPMSVFDLYSVMKSTQKAIMRGEANSEKSDQPHDVFFNIGCLAGGTIPRIHMQSYLRTRKNSYETYQYNEEGRTSLRAFLESDVIKLNCSNRTWQAYVPMVKHGKFDIRIESKDEAKDFIKMGNFELWDLAEMLIRVSVTLDSVVGIPERNIQFFPTGVVIRPFGVYGGHEGARPEMIQGQPSNQFAKIFNNSEVSYRKDIAYRKPQDKRGQETFQELVDESSPLLKSAI